MLCSCRVCVQSSDYSGAQPTRERPKSHYVKCSDVRYDASDGPVSEIFPPITVRSHICSLDKVVTSDQRADGVTIEQRLRDRMLGIANSIKQCAKLCDSYQKRSTAGMVLVPLILDMVLRRLVQSSSS